MLEMSGATAWTDGFIAGVYWLPVVWRVLFVWGKEQADKENWE